jgi:F0F1-type ATP synthase beta subunit
MARHAVPVGRSTYTIEVLNRSGRVVEEKETTRRSQEGAHRVARQFLVTKALGTKMRLLREGKVVETLTRTRDGWDYEVLNGDSVRDAQDRFVKSHSKKASTRKAR